ncbi:MAG: SGNH/GDSL hydrolase family protein [Verrucomicrobia bacterium]|nr:SGNH/GDSL hydrolase family protein [Verrucomicrobiota bacterium]
MNPTLKSAARNLLTVLISMAISLLVLEGAVRLLQTRRIYYDMEMWKYALRLKEKSDNPNLRHWHRPKAAAHLMGVDVAINSKRLRDREYAYDKEPGVYRIVALGDSVTLGWGVPFEDTYAKVLEGRLNAGRKEGAPRFEVLNAGCGNWNTRQEVEFFKAEMRKYKPDLVLLGYFLNDAEPILASNVDQSSWLNRSQLIVFFLTRWGKLRLSFNRELHFENYYQALYQGPDWEACQQAFRELADLTRADGTQLALVVLPDLHILDEERYPFKDIHGHVQNLARANDVPFLDLFDTFKGRDLRELVVARDDAHHNARAHHLAAEALYRYLLETFPVLREAQIPPAEQGGS